MFGLVHRYIRWLHTGWPAGTVERLPVVREDGSTNVPGVYLVGDLTGIPLLKFSSDTGAAAIATISTDAAFVGRDTSDPAVRDVVVIGAGVSGVAAAAEAKKKGLSVELIESSEAFSTVVNFPRAKPIYTYPTDMTPRGDLQFDDPRGDVREGLLDTLREFAAAHDIVPRQGHVERIRRSGGLLEVVLDGDATVRAHRVIVAIGRSGNYRRLDVPGEDLDHVSNRLHDPRDFATRSVLVVGGGDSALETATAIADAGGTVTLSYRGGSLTRPKPDNIERLAAVSSEAPAAGRVRVLLGSRVESVEAGRADVRISSGETETVAADAVFTMLGREAPLDFFRRSGIRVRGDRTVGWWSGLIAFLLFCIWLYHWKTDSGLPIKKWFTERGWFPFNIGDPSDPSTLLGTLTLSAQTPSFYYSMAYCLAVVAFGIRRIRRRRTPYITVQTTTLAVVQVIPLFLLPYVLLPWFGHNGAFDAGFGQSIADALFPLSEWDTQGREYWRSVGFILAWPLLFWNVFTSEPMWAWLIISFVQTFVLIPLLIWRWGKGAYCGWICSCGALAETVGDTHRQKMPHGRRWNRVNLVGQVFLVLVFVLLALRIVGWMVPDESGVGKFVDTVYMAGFTGKSTSWETLPFPLSYLNYVWFVDVLWAGILGVGLYFWFSGRVWCRFACPLAALMHIYARFSTFRILADKKKCISCNVCTSVCHQGIDVMNFANKGAPMEDPECVRCSACVQSCPTGVLQFGRVNRRTGDVLGVDSLVASPVLRTELTVEGATVR